MLSDSQGELGIGYGGRSHSWLNQAARALAVFTATPTSHFALDFFKRWVTICLQALLIVPQPIAYPAERKRVYAMRSAF